MNYSSATVEGFITRDPNFQKTKSGKSLCTFSLAIRHYSSPDSDPKVSFIDIETWEKVADICQEQVRKGKRMIVIGSLRQDRWEDANGKTKSKIKLVGNQVRFINNNKFEENESIEKQ